MKRNLNKGLMLIIVSIIVLCLLPGSGIMAEKLANIKTDAILIGTHAPPADNNKEAETIVDSLEEIPDITIQENSERQVVVVYANSSENNVKSLGLNANDIQSGEMVSDRVDILEVKEDISVDNFISQMKTDPDVLAVDQNQVIEVSALPSDAYIQSGDAWQFEKIGAGKTWDKISNTEPVVVAVIDSGLNVSHPDLQGRIAAGYDYVTGTANIVDVAGHGTMVSGCIAAVNNNGIGIAGIGGAANIKIAPYRTGGLNEKDKDLQLAYVCAAIMDAADRPEVKVINMSFGTYNNFETLQTAVADAANAGKILVAAAGNEGDLVQYTGKYSYPASYDNVISVGATTNKDGYATFSQYNNQVDLSAPGFQLFTTTKNGDYSIASGTSFSAPVISGACAVLKAVDSNLTASGVENILKETALDLGAPGRDNYFGAGLIQLDKAVESVLPKIPLSLDSFSTDKASGQEINTSIQISAMATGGQSPCEYKFYYLFNGVNIILNDFSPNNSVIFIPRQAGSYTLLVEVKDADGTMATQSINDFLILEPAVNATSITLNKTSMSIMVGASETIIVTLTPADVTDKSITWSSSDAGVVAVDASGNVKGIKIGKADITAKTSNNLKSSCSVTINEKTMTASTVEASVSGNEIIVIIKGFDAPNEVKQILVPIWSDINSQDDIRMDTAARQSDDSYSVSIDIKIISMIMGFIAFILIVQIIIVRWHS